MLQNSFKKIHATINFEKTYYYSLLMFAFLLPLSRATNSFFIILFIFLFVIQGKYRKHFTILKNAPFSKALLILIGFTFLSLLWTEDLKFGLNPKLLYLEYFALFTIALNIKVKQIPSIITTFLMGMFVSEILSYGMFFELWQVKGHGKEYPSPFMMHIDYSIFLAFAAIIILHRLLSKKYNKKEKGVLFLFFLTITGNLFINEGRTGQLGFMVAIIVSVFLHYKVSMRSILGALLLVTVIFGTAYNISEKFQARVMEAKVNIVAINNGSNYYTSLGLRVTMYYVALDILKENPLLGVGVGDYQLAAKRALKKDNHGFDERISDFITSNHFHSQYLNVLVQGGIIGLALLLMVFFHFLRLPIAYREHKELSLLIVVIFLTSFLTEPILIKQFPNALFILFAGLFLATSIQHPKKN